MLSCLNYISLLFCYFLCAFVTYFIKYCVTVLRRRRHLARLYILFIYLSSVAGSKPMNTQNTIVTQAQRLKKTKTNYYANF